MMNRKYTLAVACVIAGLICSRAAAQGSFTLYDTNTAVPHVFTNTAGVVTTNGTLIVFEGELESFVSVPKAFNLTSTNYLAALQLLTQVRLFDELPSSNEVDIVQGAVAALRNSAGSPSGTYFVWGLSNSVLTWTQLLTTNTPPTSFAVNDGETNYVTFIFNYPTNSDPVTYQVYIGDVGDPVMQPSLPITSATSETGGINSVSMKGVGGIMELGTANDHLGPLSTAVDFSVYASTNGVRIEVFTTDENGGGAITVYALINGQWTVVGVIPADQVKGSGSNRYVLFASGLEVGQSYWFKIVDEANHTHLSTSAIAVKTIKMEAVTLMLNAMRVTFNTDYGRKYQVKVSGDLSVPLDQWSTEEVSVYNAETDKWSTYSSLPFRAGPGLQTMIQIPMDQSKAFFKVILVDEQE